MKRLLLLLCITPATYGAASSSQSTNPQAAPRRIKTFDEQIGRASHLVFPIILPVITIFGLIDGGISGARDMAKEVISDYYDYCTSSPAMNTSTLPTKIPSPSVPTAEPQPTPNSAPKTTNSFTASQEESTKPAAEPLSAQCSNQQHSIPKAAPFPSSSSGENIGQTPEELSKNQNTPEEPDLLQPQHTSPSTSPERNNTKSAIEPEAFHSSFSKAIVDLQTDLEEFIHPILHGCAEPLPDSFLKKMTQIGQSLKNGTWSSAKKELVEALDEYSTAGALKATLPGIASYGLQWLFPISEIIAYKISAKLFDTIPEHKKKPLSPGATSQQVLHDAKSGSMRKFPHWKQEKKCTHNIRNCSLLGNHSKSILSGIDTFIKKIHDYETHRRLPYFSNAHDVNRILSILRGAVGRICDLNLKSALESKELSDDKELVPCLEIINSLAAFPTEFHDIDAKWTENAEMIDALLDVLPMSERDELRDSMCKLISFSKDPTYGHSDEDSGMNIYFIGPTATGKTYTAKTLLRLLGYYFIKMSEHELKHSSASPPSVDTLLTKGKLSVLERHLLSPDRPSSLNPFLFFDEFSNNALTPEDIKRLFDQHSRIYFSGIGVEVPGYINTILTANYINLLSNDPATAARFCIIHFNALSQESKKNIVLQIFKTKIKNNPILKDTHSEAPLDSYITRLVAFKPSWNLKDLLGFSKDLIVFLENEHAISKGQLHRIDPSRRTGKLETFQEFLERKARRNDNSNTSIQADRKANRRKNGNKKMNPICSSRHYASSDDDLQEDSTSGDEE